MPFLDRPNFRMHFEVVEGALPFDTLFVHGNLAGNVWWEPARDVWAARRDPSWKGRMILAEWRGCSGSREFTGPYSFPEMGEDMNALLAHLGVDRAHFVGHSTGGLIGLYAQVAEPKRYARSVLVDSVTPAGVPFPEQVFDAFRKMSEDREYCASVILGTILRQDLKPDFKERIVETAWKVHPQVWEGIPRLLKHLTPKIDASLIQQPTLVIHGQLDAVLSVDASRKLVSQMPHAELQLNPHNGHSPNIENPEAFVEMTHRFLFEGASPSATI